MELILIGALLLEFARTLLLLRGGSLAYERFPSVDLVASNCFANDKVSIFNLSL